jgi:hypothetical protein
VRWDLQKQKQRDIHMRNSMTLEPHTGLNERALLLREAVGLSMAVTLLISRWHRFQLPDKEYRQRAYGKIRLPRRIASALRAFFLSESQMMLCLIPSPDIECQVLLLILPGPFVMIHKCLFNHPS